MIREDSNQEKLLDSFARYIARGQVYQRTNFVLRALKILRSKPYALPRIIHFLGGVRRVAREEAIKVLGMREMLPETYRYRFDQLLKTKDGFEKLLDLGDDIETKNL